MDKLKWWTWKSGAQANHIFGTEKFGCKNSGEIRGSEHFACNQTMARACHVLSPPRLGTELKQCLNFSLSVEFWADVTWRGIELDLEVHDRKNSLTAEEETIPLTANMSVPAQSRIRPSTPDGIWETHKHIKTIHFFGEISPKFFQFFSLLSKEKRNDPIARWFQTQYHHKKGFLDAVVRAAILHLHIYHGSICRPALFAGKTREIP